MIPYFLAVFGGYLIGSSRKTESFGDGGEVKELWYVTDERGSVKNLSTTKQNAEVFLKNALKYSGDINYVKVPLRDWETEKVNVGNIKSYAKMWTKYSDGGSVKESIRRSLTSEIIDNIEHLDLPEPVVSYDESVYDIECISLENLEGVLKEHGLTTQDIGLKKEHVRTLLTTEEDEVECVPIDDLEKILTKYYGKKVYLSQKDERTDEDLWYSRGGEVARTILDQLGGAGLLHAMTGAYHFVDTGDGVIFRLKNPRANYVKISLNAKDLYDVVVGRIRGTAFKVVAERKDVYFDELRPFLEQSTGLALTMPRITFKQ